MTRRHPEAPGWIHPNQSREFKELAEKCPAYISHTSAAPAHTISTTCPQSARVIAVAASLDSLHHPLLGADRLVSPRA